MDCNFVNDFLSKSYRKLGSYIARKPKIFIIVPLITSALMTSGFYRVWYEQDFKYLYNPIKSESLIARDLINEKFRMNYSIDFDLGRMPDFNNLVVVIITANDGGSVLREYYYDKVMTMDRIIRDIKLVKGNETWTFKDLCAKYGKSCFRNEILVHGNRIVKIHEGYRIIKYPISSSKYTIIPYVMNLGGVIVDEYDYVTSAEAVRLLYVMDATDTKKRQLSMEWEDLFIKAMENLSFDNVTIYKFSSNAVKQEFTNTVTAAIPLYIMLIAVMIVFSFVTCCTFDWVVSKPWMGIVGIISVVLALGSGFGFVIFCGVPFIDISLTVPFMLLGIGIDDTFVMLSAWRHTESKKSVEERLGEAYAESAVSITVTSLTNFICVCIGMVTPFPAIRIFCMFAAASILLSYIYQLTFFGSWLALYGYAEKSNRHGLFFFKIKQNFEESPRSIIKRYLCYGGQSSSSNSTSPFVYFFTVLGRLMEYTSVKIFIIIIFSVYLVAGVYFSTKLEEGVNFQMFFPFDSFIAKFFEADTKYFSKYKSRIQIIVNTPLNYADVEVQNRIEGMLSEIESTPFITSSIYTESWLRQFKKYQSNFAASYFLRTYNLSSEIDFNRALREVFFQIPECRKLKSDVVFNENGTKIVASRYLIQSNVTNTIEEEKQMLLDLRRIGEKHPYEVHFLQYMFMFLDQFLLVGSVTFQAITVTAVTMIVIFALFIPNVMCVILAAFIIATVEITVIGYMTLWNVKMDTVAMLNLIICIGFSVDYTAHLSYTYVLCKKKNRKNVITLTLKNIGMPIFQGCASTILSVVPLIFAPAYIFHCFFKIVFMIIMFATLNSLFLLPVLLSFAEKLIRMVKKREKTRTESRRRMLSFRSSIKQGNDDDDDDDNHQISHRIVFKDNSTSPGGKAL
ncbi:patched domain-containing protein 3-like [Centruroides vittatus]|uniref:patched domain-containing protein 3-like n=1 Tax=Centruroides vittatus TaxID=120091 RepID=UPI00350EA6FD